MSGFRWTNCERGSVSADPVILGGRRFRMRLHRLVVALPRAGHAHPQHAPGTPQCPPTWSAPPDLPAAQNQRLLPRDTSDRSPSTRNPAKYVPDVRCGHLQVPLDPKHAQAGKIRVRYVIIPQRDQSRPLLGTIVAVEGGPGYFATGSGTTRPAIHGPPQRAPSAGKSCGSSSPQRER